MVSVQEKATVTGRDLRLELCRRSFLDFLDYVYVLDPPPGRGLIRFEKWDHLLAVAEDLVKNRLVIILKARQLGISWLIAAFAVWKARFFPGAVILLLSKDKTEGAKLLGKCAVVADNLPDWMRVERGPDNELETGFPVLGSSIRAFAATKNAGRSATATLVVQDEADFHEWLESNYGAYGPAIDAGAQLVMVSTSDKTSNDSFFKRLYRNAPQNGFVKRFIGWAARPGRDEAWRKGVEARYEVYQLEGEYPQTEEEALAPSQAIAAFNLAALKGMQTECRKPIETRGMAQYWARYTPGHRYGAFSDPSHGVGGDDAVTIVGDYSTGMIVADIQSSVLGPEDLARESIRLLHEYDDPVWGIEDNDWGIVAINTALALQYRNLYYRDDKRTKPGWHTDEASRWELWGESIDAVKDRLIVVPSEKGLAQFFTVIRNPEKGGRIEGMQGTHDDYPLAVAGWWQMRKHARAAKTGEGGKVSWGW